MKIISLVPSITETLFDFGLTPNEIIGRTKFCIYPKPFVQDIPIIGGTKNLNLEKIDSLRPDLIIANKEENTKSDIEYLQEKHDVWLTQIDTIEDNYYFLKQLGKILNKEDIAQHFYLKIYENLYFNKIAEPIKFAYLIWKDPFMAVAKNTFINDLLENFGLENIFESSRYPIINIEDLGKSDIILLSSEPYPFKVKHLEEINKIFPKKKVMLVDGEAFSWFGTRIAKSGDYYKEFLNEIKT